MTPYERSNPEKIDASRRRRIAKGSGTSLVEVNKLIKQFDTTRKMMHKAATANPKQLMQQMRRRR